MSEQQVIKELPLANGCVMRFVLDHGMPADSIDRYYTEMVHDGKPETPPFHVQLHWHKEHDEVLMVTKGRILVTVEGRESVLAAGDEPIIVPRWKIHGMRGFQEEAFALKERTNPTGSFKQEFFSDLFSNSMQPGILHAMRVMWDSDTYPHLPLNSKLLDQLFLLILGGFAKLVLWPFARPKQL